MIRAVAAMKKTRHSQLAVGIVTPTAGFPGFCIAVSKKSNTGNHCHRNEFILIRLISLITMDHVYFSPLSVDSRSIVGRQSADWRPTHRPTVGRLSTDYRPTVDRLSTSCRPTVDRQSTDSRLQSASTDSTVWGRLSVASRSPVGRLSSDCMPMRAT